ncbi:MAG: PIG-L family deacetylase, partial [Clostridia bacterium]|nr:PIG-L family deacetylase [Clostridia bacterium]
MNVLAVGCHPDDIEISCCGTLAKCVKRGDKVTVCHVANGNMGHEIIPPDELREIRAKEAKAAGSLAGIEVVSLDIGDLLPNGCDITQRDKMMELIRDVQPDFIITHSPTDYMPDHLAV